MRKCYVYIDETGDRGTGAESSPIFGMAAVVVPEDAAENLRDAVRGLRTDLRVPSDRVLSWKEYAKSHDRRRRAAEVLAGVPEIRVCYVYAKKSELRPGSYRDDQVRFYNFVAFQTYKSALWAAVRGAQADEVHLRFGHVRKFDHQQTKSFVEQEAAADARVPDHLVGSLRWVSADRYLESQAADLFGGFLKSAVWPSGDFGYVEPSYLLTVWPKLRNSESCSIPLGIMSMPAYSVLTTEPWFPCGDCPRHDEAPRNLHGPIH